MLANGTRHVPIMLYILQVENKKYQNEEQQSELTVASPETDKGYTCVVTVQSSGKQYKVPGAINVFGINMNRQCKLINI